MRKIFLLLILLISIPALAQQSKIKELEEQRKQALRDISNTDKLLKDTRQTTASLLNRIKLISGQISSRKQIVSLLAQEVDAIAESEKETEREISRLEKELKEKQDSYAKAISGMLRNRQSENKLLFILSGKSVSESYRRLRYLREYSEWRAMQADDIIEKSKELKEKKDALEKTKQEKAVLLRQRKIEQGQLEKDESNFQTEVKETQAKQKELQSVLKQKKQHAESLNKRIENLIAEEVARQERAAKLLALERTRTESAKRNNKAAASPDAKPVIPSSANVELSGSFASNKGNLPFPITGNYIITSRFGMHQHEQWKVSTSSNGIDIQSQSGAEARSVFQGEVSRVIAFPGYNNCIIVRHGNYYTFYGNIQTLYVKQGDKVSAGQALGKVYADPDTGAAEMHFQLWQNTTKLNPEPWLRR